MVELLGSWAWSLTKYFVAVVPNCPQLLWYSHQYLLLPDFLSPLLLKTEFGAKLLMAAVTLEMKRSSTELDSEESSEDVDDDNTELESKYFHSSGYCC